MHRSKALILPALVGFLLAGPALAEGDEGLPGAPRPMWGNYRLPAGPLPPEARRPVREEGWTNLGAVTCDATDTNAAGVTVCSRSAQHRFTTATRESGRYILQLRAPASHCAPIIYMAFVDGGTTPYYFGALYPGHSASASLRAAAGAHAITVGAIGDTTMGGCNSGGLTSWSVDLRLDEDRAPE